MFKFAQKKSNKENEQNIAEAEEEERAGLSQRRWRGKHWLVVNTIFQMSTLSGKRKWIEMYFNIVLSKLKI